MTDETGRPACDSCRHQKRGKKFPNMDPCRKGHSAFFTCCVQDCKDWEDKNEKGGIQQKRD